METAAPPADEAAAPPPSFVSSAQTESTEATTPTSVEDANKSENADANKSVSPEEETTPPAQPEEASAAAKGNHEENDGAAPSTSAQQMETGGSDASADEEANAAVEDTPAEPAPTPTPTENATPQQDQHVDQEQQQQQQDQAPHAEQPEPAQQPQEPKQEQQQQQQILPQAPQFHTRQQVQSPHLVQQQQQQQQQQQPQQRGHYPYSSSAFMAPMPTPIRPLPGDPRLQQPNADAQQMPGMQMQPGYATANGAQQHSMYPQQQQQQQQQFFDPTTNAVPQPMNTANDILKNDPSTASFESQWNQSVPSTADMGWAPAASSAMMAQQSMPMTSVPMEGVSPSTMAPANSVAPPAPMQDPILMASAFATRSLVPQRADEQTFALDPTNLSKLVAYGKSLSTPGHAAAFAVDLLRAAVDNEQELCAHGWRDLYQINEYEVLLQKGSIGLCMNMSVRAGCVSVTSFRRPECGVIGPAEACGMIQFGDDLIAVDGFPIQTPEDFQNVVGRLKSLKPVLLRFRRPPTTMIPIAPVKMDPHGYKRGLRTSIASLDNAEMFTAGMWHMGVRYLAPGQWAAELHIDGGGIRRLGVLPSEREAAMVYNRYIHQTYGPSATQFMNPAASGGSADGQQGLPVAVSNVRDMNPLLRQPVRRNSVKAAFNNEQKEQLRAQIMCFKYVSTGTPIPKDWLARAVKSAVPLPVQDGADKRKRKTFSAQPVLKPVKKKAKRGGKKKKGKRGQFSDESEEGSDSDDGTAAPPRETAAPTRRSGRNAGKATKSYVVKENASDFEDTDEDKPKPAKEPQAPKGPQIDKIISVRFRKESADEDDDDVVMQFLIKWKDVSYLHLSWLSTNEIEEFGHASIMRMRRYLQKNSRDVDQARENVVVGEERDLSAYFSESFFEVDRILAVKEVEEPEQINPYRNHGAGEAGQPTLKRGKKYLVKWRDLSYVDCSWEWEEDITDDRKIAAFHRHNHPPILNGAHPAMLEDVRPEPTSWAKYQESPVYNNQNTLRSYQLEGLNWLVFCWYNRRNCILADEMGLGKTVQATSILEHLRQHEHIRGPFLVIAPLATLGNWKREIETWTTMNCVVYHDSEGGADIRAFIREHEFYYPNEMYKKRGVYKFNVLVTSYQTLMADAEFLDVIPWRYIVIDEAHKLKNRETKLLQSLQNFSWDSCLLMTGTPLQNGVYELWCLLNFIEPEKFPSQQQFYDEYGELNTAEQVARLHEQLRPYMLRRVKEDVEKSIPPKEETIIDVELTTMQKKYYRAIFERNRSFLNMGASGTVANLVNVEMELRKCCNHPFLIRGVEEKECGHADDVHRAKVLVQASGKTVLLDKLLAKFRAEKKKVLIFSQFKIMLDIIEDLCQLRNYSIERMDGSVRGNSRQAAIDRFNKPDSDTFAFLLSTRAGGVGINLIAASVVILFDSDWNPQNDLQAVARCHRIGQTQSVNIYRLVTKKTYEAQMFDIASKKLGMHHAVFETGGVRNEFDGEDDGGNMMSLMSLDRDKVEMMIRYGAYAIMGGDNEEEDPENRAINEVDIDQLLSSSRTIRYDPTRGEDGEGDGEEGVAKQPTVSQSSALSFSKASFTAETSDATIDFNDEQFWEKVLGPKLVQVLMTKVQEGWLSKASKDDVKKFLVELRDLARTVVRERQRGGAMEDADQVMSILIELKVTGPIIKGAVNVRTVASEWLDVIERPKRRRNQDAESELMYLEFLDGVKKAPTPSSKKKKGASGKADSASSGRRSKSKASDRRREQFSDSEDDDDDNDDDEDEELTPVKKPRRPAKRANPVVSKSDIHIVIRKEEEGYTFVRAYSSVKKIQKSLPGAAESEPKEPPRRRGRPRKLRLEEEDEPAEEEKKDSRADEDAESEDAADPAEEAEEPERADDTASEEEADDDDEEHDESDDEDEDDDEDTPKKKRAAKQRKASTKHATKSSRNTQNGNSSEHTGAIDPQVDEEMWCRVCASDQGYTDDPIVQCERCNVAVHKYCYGIDKVPEGDTPWFCDYCGETEASASDATCALCPLQRTTAAFKKTCEGDWVHVVCALWAPGVQFSDVEHMKDVKNVPEAIAETRGEECSICSEKDGCIKCFRGSCQVFFHPLCGRESKGEYDMYMNEAGQLRAFCPKHRTRSRRT